MDTLSPEDYTKIYHDLEKAWYKRDAFYAGLYLDDLLLKGSRLDVEIANSSTSTKLEIYCANQEQLTSLTSYNVVNILKYIFTQAKLELSPKSRLVLISVPEINQEYNALNTVRYLGSTALNVIYLFDNYKNRSDGVSYLFQILINEIICDGWALELDNIKLSAEYQQFTAAFTYCIKLLMELYRQNYSDKSINDWSSTDFEVAMREINSGAKNGKYNSFNLLDKLSSVEHFNYQKHKKLFLIENQSYHEFKVQQLAQSLQSMKCKLGINFFDYLTDGQKILVKLNHNHGGKKHRHR